MIAYIPRQEKNKAANMHAPVNVERLVADHRQFGGRHSGNSDYSFLRAIFRSSSSFLLLPPRYIEHSGSSDYSFLCAIFRSSSSFILLPPCYIEHSGSSDYSFLCAIFRSSSSFLLLPLRYIEIIIVSNLEAVLNKFDIIGEPKFYVGASPNGPAAPKADFVPATQNAQPYGLPNVADRLGEGPNLGRSSLHSKAETGASVTKIARGKNYGILSHSNMANQNQTSKNQTSNMRGPASPQSIYQQTASYVNRGPIAKIEAPARIIPIAALNPYQERWTINQTSLQNGGCHVLNKDNLISVNNMVLGVSNETHQNANNQILQMSVGNEGTANTSASTQKGLT
ncbi:Replication protein A DNA-binding subunit A [Nymphaea thermarum]|nr:Replication protein A DNA-binding subunit A [Nymphaea thermarum]